MGILTRAGAWSITPPLLDRQLLRDAVSGVLSETAREILDRDLVPVVAPLAFGGVELD